MKKKICYVTVYETFLSLKTHGIYKNVKSVVQAWDK